MPLDEPCFAEHVLTAVLVQMIRSGTLAPDDLERITQDLDDDGRAFIDAMIVKAAAPSQSEWEAGRRRARFSIVPDGGKKPEQ